jgi:hypothetical protein
MINRVSCLTALAGVLLGACGSGSIDRLPPVGGTLNEQWQLADHPSASIGVVDGPEALQFTRISGALRVPDGRIVVANQIDPPQVRVFSSSGGHILSIGRAGQGPGEFRSISWIKLIDHKTIAAYDPSSARVAFFTLTGEALPSLDLPPSRFGTLAHYALVDLLPDGSGLGRPKTVAPFSASEPGRGKASIVRIDLETGKPRSIALVPDAEYTVVAGPHGTQRTKLVRFGLKASIAHAKGRIFYASGDEMSVDEFDLEGNPVRTFSRPYERRPVTEADLDAEEEVTLAELPAEYQNGKSRREIRRIPHGELMPATGSAEDGVAATPVILLDDLGYLWVQEFAGPRDAERMWSVFDPKGDHIGTLSVPRAFLLRQAGADYILGIHRDELGVQSVQVYSLRRPSQQARAAAG